MERLLHKESHHITDKEFNEIAEKSEGYTGADLKVVCKAAAMEPIRDLGVSIKYACRDDVSFVQSECWS